MRQFWNCLKLSKSQRTKGLQLVFPIESNVSIITIHRARQTAVTWGFQGGVLAKQGRLGEVQGRRFTAWPGMAESKRGGVEMAKGSVEPSGWLAVGLT